MQTLDILWFSVLTAIAVLAGFLSRDDGGFASGLALVTGQWTCHAGRFYNSIKNASGVSQLG